MDIRKIPLSSITYPPELDREALDPEELRELAASIELLDLINPITVETAGDHFMLRAGRRRCEAHRLLGRVEIMANVRSPGEVGHGELITWAENLDRSQLSFLEEAKSIKRMMDKTNLGPAAIARKLHRSVDWVDSRLELLTVPPELQDLVHKRQLPLNIANHLAKVTDPDHRAHLVHYAIQSGASFSVIRDWVSQWKLHEETGKLEAAPLPPMPIDGGRYVIYIPCMTCGQAHPAEQLRIVRICPPCVDNIIQATAEWRAATAASAPPNSPPTTPAMRDGSAPAASVDNSAPFTPPR